MEAGARLAHRWAKGLQAQVLPVGSAHANPIHLLDQKTQEWLPRWQRDSSQVTNINDLYLEVRQAALLEDPIQVDETSLADHLGKARGSRATGLDGMSNQDLKHSPPQSRAALCDIVNSIISNAIVPRQMMLNVVQLIPKPKGGDRPITITSTVLSLVMDVLGVQMNEWQEAQEAFWDDAVKGSSALRAALDRRMMDELEAGERAHTISGYCDLEKFYDSISIPKLVYHAQAADFPMRPLALILQVGQPHSPRCCAIVTHAFRRGRGGRL